MTVERPLSELREEFGRSRMLAMPIAGAICWSAAGVFGAVLRDWESRINHYLIHGSVLRGARD